MSRTSNACGGRSAHQTLNHRIVAGAQEDILKRGKRNVISRLFHKKNDKEATATWRLGLNSVLHIFNVRSATSMWQFLTLHFQTELEASAHASVPYSHHDATNTHTIIPDVDTNASNVGNIIPNVHSDNPNVDNIVPNVHPDISNANTVPSVHSGTLDADSTTPDHPDASNAKNITPDVHQNVPNTYTTGFDIHRSTLKGHGNTDGQNSIVSTFCPPPVTE